MTPEMVLWAAAGVAVGFTVPTLIFRWRRSDGSDLASDLIAYRAVAGLPYTPPKPVMPRFCSRCGKCLATARVRTGFHSVTGLPIYKVWLKCPDARKRDAEHDWLLHLNESGDGWVDAPTYFSRYTPLHVVEHQTCKPTPDADVAP